MQLGDTLTKPEVGPPETNDSRAWPNEAMKHVE